MQDDGGEVIMETLTKNRSIKHLDLSNNRLKDKTAKAAIDALKINTIIKIIKLHGNVIKAKLILRINYGLKKNKSKENKERIPKYIREIGNLRVEVTNIENMNNTLNKSIRNFDKYEKLLKVTKNELESLRANQIIEYDVNNIEQEKSIKIQEEIDILIKELDKEQEEEEISYEKYIEILQGRIKNVNKEIKILSKLCKI